MSKKQDDGGQAFPMTDRDDALKGMTLRDYFAAKAMTEFLHYQDCVHPEKQATSDHVAKLSYQMAAAMLKARKAK